MTDPQITSSLATRSPLPTVYAVISEFRISYQRALRCLLAAGGVEPQPGAVRPEAKMEVKKVYRMEDF